MQPVILIFEATVVIAFFLVAAHANRLTREHGIPTILIRLLITGEHLDGVRRYEDRTFTRDGSKPLEGNRQHNPGPMRWLSPRCGWKHIAMAWSVVLALIALAVQPVPALIALAVIAALGAFSVIVRGYRWVHPVARYHRKHIVQPAAITVGTRWRTDPALLMRAMWVHPHPELARPGDELVSIPMPDHVHADRKEKQFQEDMEYDKRLGVPSTAVALVTHEHPRRVVAICAAQPPDTVRLADHLDVIGALPAGVYFMGTGAVVSQHDDDAAIVWDSRSGNPMAMVLGRMRRGKSNLIDDVTAQAVQPHRGEQVTRIDPKGQSGHFAGVPGVRVAGDPRNPGAMAGAIHDFRLAMDDAMDHPGPIRYHLLIIDEAPAFRDLIRDWHRDQHAGRKAPLDRDNPVAQDIRRVLRMGAAFGYRMLIAGQDLDEDTLFGYRSAFGTILLCSFTDQQWNNVVGGSRVPARPQRVGRFYCVQDGVPALYQQVIADPRGGMHNDLAWRTFALAGRVPEAEYVPPAPRFRIHHQTALPPAPDQLALPRVLVGIPAAAAYLGVSANAFELARKRHGPVPGEFSGAVDGHRNRLGRKDERAKPCWPRQSLDAWWRSWESDAGVSDGGLSDSPRMSSGASS